MVIEACLNVYYMRKRRDCIHATEYVFIHRYVTDMSLFTDSVSVDKKYLTDSGVLIEKNTRFIIGGCKSALAKSCREK